ncbi:MAG: undecaprenyldiphospho-muramoylpentapeptide beta-N-acetylglucosaminyltransferase [Oscillospiraceae bacterium]|jgi:UDP-N-acetylglucosamine--N-acetylmuramyl-(pentapeptide) pyrophosphoryl-undecaprenol N-acetylglucosamine transferase|nr:undecaprenyldiphospho-muramoylpentapeptide beta-N-acetylglucosaminyltransferase [Oscillospiraceae bacterium]
MRFILTCGGSGGHINPALAVARLLREDGHEVLFIGAPSGLERDLVPREGFAIEFVDVRSLSRSFSPKAVARNIGTVVKVAGALRQARKIIKHFQPQAVLGTGGYASFPALRAASKLKIPVLVHESNAFPGVTTKMAAKHADAILVGMESCREAYKNQSRVHVVGTPVRPEFFTTDRLAAREALKLDNRPVIVSIFGSQGARDMNRMILELMKLENGEWQHIHAAGPKRYGALAKTAAERGLVFDGGTGLRLMDYIHNMAEACAAADILICRAGASTLAELAAAGKPAVLIPSPNVTADHQTANAKMLENAGGAVVMPEAGLTAENLYRAVKDLLGDQSRREAMTRSLHKLAVPNSAQRIAGLMQELL